MYLRKNIEVSGGSERECRNRGNPSRNITNPENQALTSLTAGKAALLCSVKPDTVLKWIKKGRLPAIRTVGGHYRVEERDVLQALAHGHASDESKEERSVLLRPPDALLGVHEPGSRNGVPGVRGIQGARRMVFPLGATASRRRACRAILRHLVPGVPLLPPRARTTDQRAGDHPR